MLSSPSTAQILDGLRAEIHEAVLPEVTVPFWDWLFDQDPATIRGQRFAAQQEDSRWLQPA